MANPARYSIPAPDNSAICAAQTTTGTLPFLINGTLAIQNPILQNVSSNYVFLNGIQRVVNITSTGNVSGVNITITGYDSNRQAIATTIAGPNATTVSTTLEFQEIDSVTATQAVSINTSVGTGTNGHTMWFMPNRHLDPTNLAIYISISASTSMFCGVQDTPDDFEALLSSQVVTFSHPTLTATNQASVNGNYVLPPAGVRAIFTGMVTASSSATFTIIQAGISNAN